MPMSEEARKAAGDRMRAMHARKREAGVAVAERVSSEPDLTAELTLEERAERALARRGRTTALSPMEQIRPYNPNSVPDKSAGAYYLRLDGATIADALIWYPNGAQHDREYDPRGRYSENASYYQERQRRKGFEYVGPMLTLAGARRLVEILENNRAPEIDRLEDEITLAEYATISADRPEVRDQQRRRHRQLRTRLDRVRSPFDPEELVAELQEIANAQEMASVPPQVMRVMKRMIGNVNEQLIARFTRKQGAGDPDPAMDEGKATFDG